MEGGREREKEREREREKERESVRERERKREVMGGGEREGVGIERNKKLYKVISHFEQRL